MNCPKRGCKSEDGKLYTDDKGGVHEAVPFSGYCRDCSISGVTDRCCRPYTTPCSPGMMFRGIKGADDLTDEVLAACDMARKIINLCRDGADCEYCGWFNDKNCPARAYLAEHRQPDAWNMKL